MNTQITGKIVFENSNFTQELYQMYLNAMTTNVYIDRDVYIQRFILALYKEQDLIESILDEFNCNCNSKVINSLFVSGLEREEIVNEFNQYYLKS